jgi:uncharacterized membrane protein
VSILLAGALLEAIIGVAIANAANRQAWFAFGVLLVIAAVFIGVVVDAEVRSRRA